MNIIPSKKISWFLLVSSFTFDGVFSYYAVTRLGGHEANLLIAHWVEKYPLLYFLCIPTQAIIVYFIVMGILKIAMHILKRWKINNRELVKRVILFAMVIYSIIGNSLMNLSFLLGHRLPMFAWIATSAIGICVALIYSFVVLSKVRV
jgi:hypothetical protein